jgi:DNA-binding transcriptional LysR family regulator
MDRLIASEVLLETVARGSISAAAEHLKMSRAMASRYIGMMEEWAGARLLHRTTRKLSLTPAGEQILPVCRAMLTLANDVASIGNESGEMPKGLLRIAASAIFAEYCLVDMLMEFLQVNRAISIDLQILDRKVNLAEDGIDLAIRVTSALDPNLIARKLGECPSVLCASPSYLKARGVPAHVRDLTAHDCLIYAEFGRSPWRFKAPGEDIVVPVRGSFSTNEALILMRAALSGVGIAMLPRFAVKQAIDDGKLIQILPEFEAEHLSVFAVYLSRQHMPQSLRALIDFLLDNLTLAGSR